MDYGRWERNGELWGAFDSLRGEMDRALGLFALPAASGLLDRASVPAVDVVERDDDYLVIVDLPGVKKNDLELSIQGTLLSIKGDKKAEKEPERRGFFRKETWTGGFARTIDLPARIDPDSVSAELKDGVLAVRVAKREEAKRKAIAVAVR
jgi:HSP20 family protein